MKKLLPVAALVSALALNAACGHQTPPPGSQESSAPVPAHQHRAPHGGVLVELGAEFAHVEMVLDPDEGTLTAYVLDGEAEESIRLRQPSVRVTLPDAQLELPARADILTGETVGDSSEFSVASPSLLHRSNLKGRIVEITVKGQVFRDISF